HTAAHRHEVRAAAEVVGHAAGGQQEGAEADRHRAEDPGASRGPGVQAGGGLVEVGPRGRAGDGAREVPEGRAEQGTAGVVHEDSRDLGDLVWWSNSTRL